MSSSADDQREYLVLGFSNPSAVNFVDIYETLNPGAVDSVYLKNAITDAYELVYSNTASASTEDSRILHIEFPLTTYDVDGVRIALNSPLVVGFNAIDAVGIGEIISPPTYTSYLWSPNGETTSSISVSSTGTYTVQVTEAGGCTGSASIDVYTPSQTIPTISIDPSESTTFCDGGSVTLISSEATGNTWSTGETTQSIVVTTSGSYTVSHDDNSGCGAVTSAPTVVTVNPLPTPSISGTLAICPSSSTTLDAGAGYASYAWSNGAVTQTITVSVADIYTVTVTDGNGCAGSTSATTTIAAPPSPSISGITTFCPGGSTTLDAGFIYSFYAWSTGATTQTINVTTAGTYSVTVTDANGCTGNTDITTSIFTPPSPVITGNPSFCPGSSTTLDAGNGYAIYSWSTGATTQTISVNTIGTFSVTVTDGNGCTGNTSIVTSEYIPPAPVITGSFAFCGGSATALDAGSGYASYLWSTGETSQAIVVSSVQTYSVTVTDLNGCSGSASATTTVTGSIPDSPGPITGPTTGLCNVSGIVYSIDPVPNTTHYVWTVPAGVTILSGQGTTSIIVDIDNTFTGGDIVVAASNPCGQSPSINPTFITLQPAPGNSPGQVSGPTTGLCNQSNASYSISPVAGATSYIWTVPDGASIISGQGTSSITLNFGSLSGDVCVSAATDCGYTTASCISVTLPVFEVDAGDCINVFPGVSPLDCTELTANTSGGVTPFTYAWVNSLGVVVGNTQSITVCPTVNTTYRVQVTDANGCIAKDKVTVEPIDATCGPNKVWVCFKGRSRCVNLKTAQNILKNGGRLGRCDDIPCGGSTTLTPLVKNNFNSNSFELEIYEDATSKDELHIYPNPSGDYFHIELSDFDGSSVTIDLYDPLSSRIKHLEIERIGSDPLRIDVTDVPSGLYIISVKTDEGYYSSRKLIVSH
jgi:hypothetical protein